MKKFLFFALLFSLTANAYNENATVIYHGNIRGIEDHQCTISLVRADGQWLVSAIDLFDRIETHFAAFAFDRFLATSREKRSFDIQKDGVTTYGYVATLTLERDAKMRVSSIRVYQYYPEKVSGRVFHCENLKLDKQLPKSAEL